MVALGDQFAHGLPLRRVDRDQPGAFFSQCGHDRGSYSRLGCAAVVSMAAGTPDFDAGAKLGKRGVGRSALQPDTGQQVRVGTAWQQLDPRRQPGGGGRNP